MREKLEAPNRYDVRKELEGILEDVRDKQLAVLDAGAGDCFTKRFFVGTKHKYTAMDLVDGEAVSNPFELDIFGDIQNMPFENDNFDLVLCLEVLEHIPEPELALEEIFRVLKKRGILLLSAPLMSVGFHKDFYRFTPPTFKKMLETAGFQVKKIKAVGGYYRMLGWQISKISYLVKKPKSEFLWLFYYLIKIPIGLIFQIIIPLILFHLDWLDKKKTETCGYMVVAAK